jgi:hypothetical protein
MISKNNLTILVCVLFIIVTTGCRSTMYREASKRAPVARTPVIHNVIRPGEQDGRVVPNIRGEYEVLPAESILVQISTDYLVNFSVDIDGDTLPLVEEVTQRELEARDKGYYTASLNKNLSTSSLAYWDITVYPQPDKRNDTDLNINIRTISVNPKHIGRERISTPLTILVVSDRILA